MTTGEDSSSSSLKARVNQLQQQQQQQQVHQSSSSSTPAAPTPLSSSLSPLPPSSSNRRTMHRPRRLKSGVHTSGGAAAAVSNTNMLPSAEVLKESGSLLWTLLLVGLVFCLIDISYMVIYLERGHDALIITTTTTTTTTASLALPDNNGMNSGGRSATAGLPQARKLIQQHPSSSFTSHAIVEVEEPPGPPKSRAVLEAERAPILQLLQEAGIGDLDDDTLRLLPTWAEFTSLYGAEPHIYGLQNCQAFQNRSDPADHFLSTAGNFNTGTNLMAELLISNCHMQKRMDKYGEENRGIRWQVPWGKHTPPGDEEYRQTHKTRNDVDVDPNNIMPAVTIRDPYHWLKSMCRHPYGLEWPTTEEHCPNLVPNQYDLELYPFLRTMKSIPVFARYLDFDRSHDSLVHNWNDWYKEYMHVQFPFVMVRYEDLLFRPKQMIEQICECAGGSMNGHFEYIVDSAKRGPGAHGQVRTSYVDALIQYGSPKRRLVGLMPEDVEFANQHLDKDLMKLFGYPIAPSFAKEIQQLHQADGDEGRETTTANQQ